MMEDLLILTFSQYCSQVSNNFQ